MNARGKRRSPSHVGGDQVNVSGSGNIGKIENSGNLAARDVFEVGTAAAVGPGARAADVQFNSVWDENRSSLDLVQLARDLAELRAALKNEASSPEHDLAIAEVARAELAAKDQDGPKALERLAAAGKWAFEVASKIGTTVAAAAIKAAIGL